MSDMPEPLARPTSHGPETGKGLAASYSHAGPDAVPQSLQSPATAPQLRVMLFDAEGNDHDVNAADIDLTGLTEHQLLWIDQCGADEDTLIALIDQLGLTEHAAAVRAGLNGVPRVENFGEWFLVRAIAVKSGDGIDALLNQVDQNDDIASEGNRGTGRICHAAQDLMIVTGPNFVLTLHSEPLSFLNALRQREKAETQLGVLSAESFTASLLDWQLSTYFDAVSEFEAAVDRLEVSLLENRRLRDCLPQLAELRRVVSHLRKQLSPHRNLFAALERPDFRPSEDSSSSELHFHQIGKRFDHAMEAIENARAMVVGSFELFATRAAQRTNDNMRRLTFATVLIGTLAVLAGVLGMNFDVAFFESGAKGFWSAIIGMVTIAVVALVVARARDWL